MDREEPVWEREVLSEHNGGGRDSEARSQASGDWTFQLAKPGCHLLSMHRPTRTVVDVGQIAFGPKWHGAALPALEDIASHRCYLTRDLG